MSIRSRTLPTFLQATTFASMDTPRPFETVATEAYYRMTLPGSCSEVQPHS
jgi:hypothetical protein